MLAEPKKQVMDNEEEAKMDQNKSLDQSISTFKDTTLADDLQWKNLYHEQKTQFKNYQERTKNQVKQAEDRITLLLDTICQGLKYELPSQVRQSFTDVLSNRDFNRAKNILSPSVTQGSLNDMGHKFETHAMLKAKLEEDLKAMMGKFEEQKQAKTLLMDTIFSNLSLTLPAPVRRSLENAVSSVDSQRMTDFMKTERLTCSTMGEEDHEKENIRLKEELSKKKDIIVRLEVSIEAFQTSISAKNQSCTELTKRIAELQNTLEDMTRKMNQSMIHQELDKEREDIIQMNLEQSVILKDDYKYEQLQKVKEELQKAKEELIKKDALEDILVKKNAKLDSDLLKLKEEKMRLEHTLNRNKEEADSQIRKFKELYEKIKEQNNSSIQNSKKYANNMMKKDNEITLLKQKIQNLQRAEKEPETDRKNEDEKKCVSQAEFEIQSQEKTFDHRKESYEEKLAEPKQLGNYEPIIIEKRVEVVKKMSHIQMFQQVYNNVEDILDDMPREKALRTASILENILKSWKREFFLSV